MKFSVLEHIISEERLQRYLLACNGNKAMALALYRINIKISLEMFGVVGAFEVALRNAIDKVMTANFGGDWLRDAILPGGIFDIPACREHARIIRSAYEKLSKKGKYSHGHLIAQMEFGIWKYMFSSPQFRAANRVLLSTFPNKPISTSSIQYNNTYIFNELHHVNSLRNRIAHHEPICFTTGSAIITTTYIRYIYDKIMILFNWLDINGADYLRGIEHVKCMCDRLDLLINRSLN